MSADDTPPLFSSMSYKQLLQQCKQRGLTATGRTEALISRLEAAASPQAQSVSPLPVRMCTSPAMEALLSEPCYTDVRFLAGPEAEEVPAHRALLAAHSDVLKAMLQADCRESQDRAIPLPDVAPATVRAFVRLCYCGSVCGSPEELVALLELCHLYQAQRAVAAVAQALAAGLTPANALQLYAVGCTYAPPLRAKAFAYIGVECEEVFGLALQSGSAALAECTRDQLRDLLRRDDLGLREEEVYRVVLQWGRCHQEGRQPPLPQLVGELLPTGGRPGPVLVCDPPQPPPPPPGALYKCRLLPRHVNCKRQPADKGPLARDAATHNVKCGVFHLFV